jgi:hypothetical protein
MPRHVAAVIFGTMHLSNFRVLGICLAGGLALGIVGGTIYALAADKLIVYGIATGLLVTGIGVLALGLLGATEPKEGWSLQRRVRESETPRRSLVARAAYEHPKVDKEQVSSASLAVWGLVVGGGLILLSQVAFSLAT